GAVLPGNRRPRARLLAVACRARRARTPPAAGPQPPRGRVATDAPRAGKRVPGAPVAGAVPGQPASPGDVVHRATRRPGERRERARRRAARDPDRRGRRGKDAPLSRGRGLPAPNHRDGAWLCELDGVREADAVPDAVAGVFGLDPSPGVTVSDL